MHRETCASPTLPVSGFAGLSTSEYAVVPVPTDKSLIIQHQCHNRSVTIHLILLPYF